MPRRKKHTKLPNGYGSCIYLGKNRRRPYAAYPPAQIGPRGTRIRPKALGYCETYEEARELLVLYHNGLTLPDVPVIPKHGPTFAEVYERFLDDKFGNAGKPLSESAKASYTTAYKNAAVLHQKDFLSITYPELQAVVDSCGLELSVSSLSNLVKLFHGMYKYAEKYEITDKDQSRHVEIRKANDIEHGVPFSDADILRIWSDYRQNGSGTAAKLLVMIYSGFRISAFSGLLVRLVPDWYFQGGVKTAAGKDRIVPIHSGIRKIVTGLTGLPRTATDKSGLGISKTSFGAEMRAYLPTIGIREDHTPHDCRHTFSRLCESSGMPEADRKRLLGHSFGADITNAIYGHRTVEELRASIERIRIP